MGEQNPDIDVGGLGRYLRSIREARRLSLDAVEEMTLSYPGRVTKSHLSRIENGQAEPTFPRMYALSQVYGLPMASLAERFEEDLRRRAMPPGLVGESSDELFQQAKRLHHDGRYAEALTRIELVIERRQAGSNAEANEPRLVELFQWRISCLADLDRFAAAKDRCEELLALGQLSLQDHVVVLYQFARCCHRLSRFTIAMMAVGQIESRLDGLKDPRAMRALVAGLKGNLHTALGQPHEALPAFKEAVDGFEALADDFELCRWRINLGVALEECGKFRESRRQLQTALKDAKGSGYPRQMAYALHALGKLCFRQDDHGAAESYLIESNKLGREREYVSVVFCNCFYLWKIAVARADGPAALAHRRTLRAHLSRVPDSLPEAREFRQIETGGNA